MNDDPEIVFNLWYLIDESSGLCYNLLGRAYAMSGSDDEKLARLRELANTDWMLSKRYKLPITTTIVGPDGEHSHKGVIAADQFQSGIDMNWIFEGVFADLEKEFPPKFTWKDGELVTEPLKASQTPLIVRTCLMEDDNGDIRPNIAGRVRIDLDRAESED